MPGHSLHYALDIGSSALKLFRYEAGGRPRIRSIASHEFPDTVRSPETFRAALADGLTKLFRTEDRTHIKPLRLTVPPAETFIRYITLPYLPEQKVRRIIGFEAEQQIPFPIEEVLWDYALLASPAAGERHVLLAAVKNDLMQEVLGVLGPMRFSIEVITAQPLALYHLCRSAGPHRWPVLAIDLGARSASVLVLDQNSFWSRSLSFGGWRLIDLLGEKAGRKISLVQSADPEAEKMRQTGEMFFLELVNEISRTLDFYQTQGKRKNFSRVFLTGGLSAITGLSGFFEKHLGLPTQRLDPGSACIVGNDLAPKMREQFPRLATAVGLALHPSRAETERKNVNTPALHLVSSETHSALETKRQHRRYLFFLLGALLLLLAGAGNVFMERGAKQDALDFARARLVYYQQHREAEQALEQKIKTHTDRLALLGLEVDLKSVPLNAFEILAARTPQSVWFKNVIWDASNRTLELTGAHMGSLEDINHYADQLQQAALFKSVAVVSAGIAEASGQKAQAPPSLVPPLQPFAERTFTLRIEVRTPDEPPPVNT